MSSLYKHFCFFGQLNKTIPNYKTQNNRKKKHKTIKTQPSSQHRQKKNTKKSFVCPECGQTDLEPKNLHNETTARLDSLQKDISHLLWKQSEFLSVFFEIMKKDSLFEDSLTRFSAEKQYWKFLICFGTNQSEFRSDVFEKINLNMTDLGPVPVNDIQKEKIEKWDCDSEKNRNSEKNRKKDFHIGFRTLLIIFWDQKNIW